MYHTGGRGGWWARTKSRILNPKFMVLSVDTIQATEGFFPAHYMTVLKFNMQQAKPLKINYQLNVKMQKACNSNMTAMVFF